jgi:hypothetical protein
MITSIIGFFVAYFLVYRSLGYFKWGAAFMALFIIMFIASMVSMSNATTDPDDLEVLAVHYKRR